ERVDEHTLRYRTSLWLQESARAAEILVRVPAGVDLSKPAPLLLVRHVAGGDGASALRQWAPLADRCGLVLAAPTETYEMYRKDGWAYMPDAADGVLEALRFVRRHHDIDENRVFLGEDRDIVGTPADRIHMLVAGSTVFPVRLDNDELRPAPYAEVSYILKTSRENPNLLELWRREDPLFDKELWRGGNYQLLSKRVRFFDVNYYEDLGEEAEPIENWDSAEKKTLPRRIKIELELERSAETHNALVEVEEVGGRTEKYERHIVFSQDRVNILNEGIALVPVVPSEAPTAENAQAGGGGGGGGAGNVQRGRNTIQTTGPGGPGRPNGGRGIPGMGGGRGATTIPIPGLGGRSGGGGGLDGLFRQGTGGGGNRGGGGGGRGR
ncbi:MAG: hypothetical protein KDC95_23430, partial [Planctomycetes bacterium]|nr:hypothetical protein [Planctomycetota bacterium]